MTLRRWFVRPIDLIKLFSFDVVEEKVDQENVSAEKQGILELRRVFELSFIMKCNKKRGKRGKMTSK